MRACVFRVEVGGRGEVWITRKNHYLHQRALLSLNFTFRNSVDAIWVFVWSVLYISSYYIFFSLFLVFCFPFFRVYCVILRRCGSRHEPPLAAMHNSGPWGVLRHFLTRRALSWIQRTFLGVHESVPLWQPVLLFRKARTTANMHTYIFSRFSAILTKYFVCSSTVHGR